MHTRNRTACIVTEQEFQSERNKFFQVTKDGINKIQKVRNRFSGIVLDCSIEGKLRLKTLYVANIFHRADEVLD